MSTIHSVPGGNDQQWQLLQQLRSSRAAETAAGTAPAAAAAPSAPGAGSSSATPTTSTAALPAASGTTGIFDSVAAKLISGIQSFLVNMQSDTGNAGSAASAGSVHGYGKPVAGSADASMTTGLMA